MIRFNIAFLNFRNIRWPNFVCYSYFSVRVIQVFRIRYATLQDAVLWFVLIKKCYINIYPIINRYIATNILVFQDIVRCCTVSVLTNHLRANSHLWQRLLSHNSLRSAQNRVYKTVVGGWGFILRVISATDWELNLFDIIWPIWYFLPYCNITT